MQKIIILGTGGTIAGWAPDLLRPDVYHSAQLDVRSLVAGCGEAGLGDCEFEQLAQIDSKDASDDFWRALLSRVIHHLNRPDVKGLVITHGTDTLEETAFLLSVLLPGNKPVALTGAMRAANHPQADGPANLRDALNAVRAEVFRGVAVVMQRQWWDGAQVQKVRAFAEDALACPNPAAHGRLPASAQGGGLQFSPAPAVTAWPSVDTVLSLTQWPRVELVMSHGGAQAWLLKALRQDRLAPRLRGLVLVGTGAGTWHESLGGELRALQASGVVCWVSTRCTLERLPMAVLEGMQSVPFSPPQARLALMLELINSGH